MIDPGSQNDQANEPPRRLDRDAFAALVAEHQPVVLGLCQAMGLRGADVDDAAAEVFANVFRALPRFEGRSAVGTWVYRIACRTIPKVRAQCRRRHTGAMPDNPTDDREPAPPRQTETAETNQRVWAAVAELDSREAMAVEMRYRFDWPIERIAEALECPAGTVKTLLFRARQKLKLKLSRLEMGT